MTHVSCSLSPQQFNQDHSASTTRTTNAQRVPHKRSAKYWHKISHKPFVLQETSRLPYNHPVVKVNCTTKATMASKHTSKVSFERIDSGFLSDLITSARNSDEAAAALPTSSPPGSTKYVSHLHLRPHISSRSCSELTLCPFDDTEWDDVGRSSAYVAHQNRLCRQISACIKTPTRFPIKPLPETMDRAREEAKKKEARKEAARKSGGSFVNSLQVPMGPIRITIVNHSTVTGRDFRPKKIVLVNCDRAHEREFRPIRLVLINRRPVQENDVITSNNTKGLLAGESNGYGQTRAASKKLREQGPESDKISRKRKSDGSAEGARQHKTSKLDTCIRVLGGTQRCKRWTNSRIGPWV